MFNATIQNPGYGLNQDVDDSSTSSDDDDGQDTQYVTNDMPPSPMVVSQLPSQVPLKMAVFQDDDVPDKPNMQQSSKTSSLPWSQPRAPLVTKQPSFDVFMGDPDPLDAAVTSNAPESRHTPPRVEERDISPLSEDASENLDRPTALPNSRARLMNRLPSFDPMTPIVERTIDDYSRRHSYLSDVSTRSLEADDPNESQSENLPDFNIAEGFTIAVKPSVNDISSFVQNDLVVEDTEPLKSGRLYRITLSINLLIQRYTRSCRVRILISSSHIATGYTGTSRRRRNQSYGSRC